MMFEWKRVIVGPGVFAIDGAEEAPAMLKVDGTKYLKMAEAKSWNCYNGAAFYVPPDAVLETWKHERVNIISKDMALRFAIIVYRTSDLLKVMTTDDCLLSRVMARLLSSYTDSEGEARKFVEAVLFDVISWLGDDFVWTGVVEVDNGISTGF